MKVIQHKPYARGVSQLMYVGDDQPVEQPSSLPTTIKLGIVAIALWFLCRP